MLCRVRMGSWSRVQHHCSLCLGNILFGSLVRTEMARTICGSYVELDRTQEGKESWSKKRDHLCRCGMRWWTVVCTAFLAGCRQAPRWKRSQGVTAMPALSRFANQQTVVFVVLAKNEETTWRPPTVVLRCATANGEEFELHMVAQAFGQGQKMSIGASFSAVVDSGGIKPYRAPERLRGWYLVRVLGNQTNRVFIYGDVCNWVL